MGAGVASGCARAARGRARRRSARPWLLLALAFASACGLIAGSDDASAPPPNAPAAEIPVPPAPARAGGAMPPASTASALPAGRAATRIERVTIESTPPTTRVVLQLDGAAEPEVSLLVNQRLVVDVPGTTCEALPRVVESAGDPLVERVRTGQHAAPAVKSRVVIDLRERADFTVRSQDDRIVVLLAPASPGGAAGMPQPGNVILGAEPSGGAPDHSSAAIAVAEPSPAPPPLPSAAPTPTESPTPAIEATSAPTPGASAAPTPAPPDETPEGAPIPAPPEAVPPEPAPPEAAPPGAAPPEASPTETAAPAQPEETAPLPGATPTAVDAALSPMVEATRSVKRISIDFTEADVRTVIDLIAAAGGYRVIFTPEVAGTISITLVDRPFEDALATVLRAKQLREVRHEDVMLVSPLPRGQNGPRRASP